MELIDEMKSHLPIPAYASRDLSNYLLNNGINTKSKSGDEGGIMCFVGCDESGDLCHLNNAAQGKAGPSSVR